MPDTLHEVARRMAAAGRLPGLAEGARGRMCRPDESTPDWWAVASEGDLMHAAIRRSVRRLREEAEEMAATVEGSSDERP